MSVKKYLNGVKYLNQDIQSRQREKESYYSTLLQSSKWKDSKVQETNKGSYDDKYDDLFKLGESIDTKIDALFKMKQELSREIDLVQSDDERFQIILRDKYLNLRSWKQIAYDLDISVDRVYRLHGEALKEFARVVKPYNNSQ